MEGGTYFELKERRCSPYQRCSQCLVQEIQYQNSCDAPEGSIVHTKWCGRSPNYS